MKRLDARCWALLEDPNRFAIVGLARLRAISPSEFARISGVKLGIVSYHFRVLSEAGLLELVEEERVGNLIRHCYRTQECEWGVGR